jgi:hypothetical protein
MGDIVAFLALPMFWLLSKVGRFPPKLLVTLMMAEKKKISLVFWKATACTMEQCALKNVNNCLNTDIYSYLVTPGG